jgi:biotin carboxylase
MGKNFPKYKKVIFRTLIYDGYHVKRFKDGQSHHATVFTEKEKSNAMNSYTGTIIVYKRFT